MSHALISLHLRPFALRRVGFKSFLRPDYYTMTDLAKGLIQFGFVGGASRLDALVAALRDLEFDALEELYCADRFPSH